MQLGKEKDFFHLTTFTDADLYVRYRRLSEFESALSIAEKDFTDQVTANILIQDKATQMVYLDRLTKKFKSVNLQDYVDYQKVLIIFKKHDLDWCELDAFYRTMHDLYVLEMKVPGVINYHNREPDIPTDYDSPEMDFLKRGVGFMTSDDWKKSEEYNKRYGQYTKDTWDVFKKDILPEKRFLELLRQLYDIAPNLDRNFDAGVMGQPARTISQVKFYVFNGLQKQSLTSASTFIDQTRKLLMKDHSVPNFDNFEIFIKSFEYNYPYKGAVISSVYSWENHLQYLKKEILENLIILSGSGRSAYLKRIRLGCEELLPRAYVPFEALEKWLQEYDTSLKEAIDTDFFSDTELHKALISEPETFKESLEQDIPQFYTFARHDFYNYFYGDFLRSAITFVDEQDVPVQQSGIENLVTSAKLKSTLNVGQLSYLFKLLMEEGLLEYKHKTDVYRFIATNFETKKASIISTDSIKNQMDNPDYKNIDVMQEKILHILQAIKKDKENLGR